MHTFFNKDSIFFKINTVFFIAIAAVLIAGFSLFGHVAKRDFKEVHFKALEVKHHIEYGTFSQDVLDELNMVEVQGDTKQKILQTIKNERPLMSRKDHHFKRGIKVFHYQRQLYAIIHTRSQIYLLQDTQSFFERSFLYFLGIFAIVLLLILIYITLRRTFEPLYTLKEEIIKYGKGDSQINTQINTQTDKKDEISIVANEFNKAVVNINRLTEARKLFLRNILHELNTPITKGKILVELVENEKQQEILDSVFSRLDSLIKELADIEKITSNSYKLEKKEYRIIDIIDNAKDLLFLEEEITHNIQDHTLKCDFRMMSIVFKNLIDNASKYSSDFNRFSIHYENDQLQFISSGEPLPHEFSYYTQPFHNDVEHENPQRNRAKPSQTSQKGFGLGLYIVNEILKKHGMTMTYFYEKGCNVFITNWTKHHFE